VFGKSPYAADRLLGETVDDLGRSMIVESISNKVTDYANRKLSPRNRELLDE